MATLQAGDLRAPAAPRPDGPERALERASALESDAPTGAITSHSPSDQISVELAARRTGMSFQRTRMSADRTLMSVIRTSLSLIGFGFTIFQVFQKLQQAHVLSGGSHAPRNFGAALVWLGVAMLVLGIGYHVLFMTELRKTREELVQVGLVHGQSRFPPSLTLITAVLLLAVGIAAILSMLLGWGPLD